MTCEKEVRACPHALAFYSGVLGLSNDHDRLANVADYILAHKLESSNIKLGERVFFNFNCVVLDVCPVQIGSFALFGPAVQVYTPMHPFNAEQRRREEFGRPVVIGSDVWVGGGAIILPGVRIGNRAVIGARSVVTRDIPERVFAAGNPCRVVREITE